MSRIEKFKKKISGDNRKRLYDSQKDVMIRLETRASIDLAKIELQVKQMAQGYPALHLPYYIIFAKEIYSKQRKFKGQTLLNEIIILEEKWERRGLDPDLLDRIKLFYVPAYIKMIFVMPVGIIEMYGAAAAPTGWLLCNGAAVSRTTYADLFAVIGTTYGVGNGTTTFNVPDFQGIFPRGAGASGKLNDANGNPFAGTLGTYQNDKFQGHYHEKWYNVGITGAAGGAGVSKTASILSGLHEPDANKTIRGPLTDTAHGTNRHGNETNPANLGINFIIKY